MRRQNLFFMNGIILTISSFFMSGIGMIFNLYISNKIGTEAVGLFSLVMSVYMFAITFATSGLSLACTCIISEQLECNSSLIKNAMKTCITFSIVLGLGSSILLILVANPIASLWLKSMVSSKPLYVIALGLPFIAISSVLNGYFSAIRKSYKTAFVQIFELLIKVFFTIVLLNIFSTSNVENICICLVLADVISEFCSCSILIVLYNIDKRNYMYRSSGYISFGKKIFQLMLPVSITSYIRSGLSTLKQFMIPSGLVKYGYTYTLALSEYGKINGMVMGVILFPTVFISSFSRLLVPEFSSLLAVDDKNRMKNILNKAFTLTSFFSILVSCIFFFFSEELSLAVFQSLNCAPFIKALSPLVLFIYLDNIIDSILKGLHKQFGVMVCNLLDLVITISFIYFLLPLLGLNGYIIVICISEVFNFVVSYYQLYKLTGFKIDWLNSVIRPFIFAFVSYIFTYFMFPLSNVAIKLVLFSFVYLFFICIFKTFRKS